MGGGKGNKMTLEEYVAFHENPQSADLLTLKHLKEIIFMHGFIKIHNRPKKEIIDALNSIDLQLLLSPHRSTLTESSISSCAFLSLEQVKEDLQTLEWQECPIQSIQTLKSAEENLLAANDIQIICASSTSDPCHFLPSPATVDFRARIGKSRSKKRKKEGIDAAAAAAATSAVVADNDALLSSPWLSLGFY